MSISEKFHIFQKKAEGLVMCKDYSAAKETYSDCICQLKMELETVQECQHVKLFVYFCTIIYILTLYTVNFLQSLKSEFEET